MAVQANGVLLEQDHADRRVVFVLSFLTFTQICYFWPGFGIWLNEYANVTVENAQSHIRLTFEERARLERAAGNRPLGEYIRIKLLGEDAKARKAVRRPKSDQRVLAQILAALGSSSLGPDAANQRTLSNASTNDQRSFES